MPPPEQPFRWTWQLAASPAALWPLVSDTDRFNRDCGYPPVTVVPPPGTHPGLVTNLRRLRATVFGVPIEWEELAFEWFAPERFAVERRYSRGPLRRMIVSCELAPLPGGGTNLTYDMRVTPAGWLGRALVPFAIGRRAGATMERIFRRYDAFAIKGLRRSALAQKPKLVPGGAERMATIGRVLATERGQEPELVVRLQQLVAEEDDLDVARLRPYAVADAWHASRRDVLHLFLHASRAGMLDFSWDVICPHCRGAKSAAPTLAALSAHAHCDACNVDFTANFDRLVELTFAPNSSIRSVTHAAYCVGGPQVTPHILAQCRIPAGGRRSIRLAVVPGRYRLRSTSVSVQNTFRVEPGGAAHAELVVGSAESPEPQIAPDSDISIANPTHSTVLALVEHLTWSDQAATAADVTALQLFRDLFSREVLRPGEQISVGTITIVFTDLKNSTQLYRQIGDAPAFGRVLTHFEILKAAVADENGAIVKTMGDAIMAVFPRPVSAVRAMVRAQRWLARPADLPAPLTVGPTVAPPEPLALKAGLHAGPCLVISQNERLDYFGTTVNTAARLCGHCSGTDVVLSSTVATDPEVRDFVAAANDLVVRREEVRLKGFGDMQFEIQRLATAGPPAGKG